MTPPLSVLILGRRSWAVTCLSILLLGCGDDHLPIGKVTGTVTLDGQPVSNGIVHFMPQSGPAASGVIQDGKYSLSTYAKGDGAVVGSHTVYFAPAADESYMARYTEADYATGTPPPESPAQNFLPERYLTPSSSGLTAEVQSGANQQDFPLMTSAN